MAIYNGFAIGHATLSEVEPRKLYEYSIFVHQNYQNRGVGTEMTRTMKACAQTLGFRRIWLTVNQLNIRAIKVFKKAGFKFLESMDIDGEMVLDL